MVKHRQHNSATKQSSPGYVRIISGLWRGRKLPVCDSEGLRPTTDRIKETVFNWLAGDIAHSRCLDLFSGAGSLGFEAASRQADKVVMIELDPKVHRQLAQNIQTLKADTITLIQNDALNYLAQSGTPFDIVFIDPPFRKNLLEETLNRLDSNGWLAPDALIYIESEKEWQATEIPAHWRLYREKTAGQVSFRLFINDRDTSDSK